jgi:hypothetical protein
MLKGLAKLVVANVAGHLANSVQQAPSSNPPGLSLPDYANWFTRNALHECGKHLLSSSLGFPWKKMLRSFNVINIILYLFSK